MNYKIANKYFLIVESTRMFTRNRICLRK